MTTEPFKATICGKERLVRGWDKTGEILMLEDGGQFEFKPLSIPRSMRGEDCHCRRLLAVATLESTAEGWLIDGRVLPDVAAQEAVWLAASGDREAELRQFGLLVLRSELGDLNGEVPAGVAWFARAGGNQGWDEPLLLRSFRAVPGEGAVTLAGQNRQEKPRDEARAASIQTPKRDFQQLKLPNGKTVRPPQAAREVLVALDSLGRRNVPSADIKREVARMRGSKNTATPSESYSPLKTLRGSLVGREIIDTKAVSYRSVQRQQLTLYTLHVV